jgi:hypothetical protein
MTPIAVVTVFAPRPEHPNWRDDYVPLLKLQRATANRFGHPHIVVTDGDLGRDFDEMAVMLPANLMRAQLAGQIAWLVERAGERLRDAPRRRRLPRRALALAALRGRRGLRSGPHAARRSGRADQ